MSDDGMVARNKIMSETNAAGKTASHRGTSFASASVVKFTDQGSMTAGQNDKASCVPVALFLAMEMH